MSPTPSGRLVRTPEGRDLVLIRTFRAPIEDVWASITESERTARWFAAWTGEAGPGRTIQYKMGFEGDGPGSEMQIVACEPPRHLAVKAVNDYGGWHLEGFLSEAGGITELRFVHHLGAATNVGDVGPGWEYYLDNLVASRDGAPMPDWNDYYPAQKAYYLEREAELTASA
jgi:uncharacterized protein YndB with AHSA1/START domain